MERDEGFYNRVGVDRIASRQIDELVGLARGVCADGTINQAEAEFLEKWLAASGSVSDQPVIDKLYARISEMLGDGQLDDDERLALFETLDEFGNGDLELGELLKSTTLPLCRPAPHLEFVGRRFTFTGTFSFGQRRECERAVLSRGASAGSLTRETNYLVVGVYATESWKHSSFGTKIMKACDMRDAGVPISIVSEDHWAASLS
jgi:NAD-dependent DNA ligase